jgi:hypothetical protein
MSRMSRLLVCLPTIVATSCLDPGEVPEVFDEQAPGIPCSGKCDGGSEAALLGTLPDASLATLFAPYEPALGLDLLLIRQVMAARAADPAVYPEGGNPYRIRFAVYNLDNPHIAAGLADAEDANIDVQVLIEQDQLDPARDYNVQDDFLVARGFELAPDHRALDAEGRRTADLVGISGSGLMHLKTRLYTWRDPASGESVTRLVTGSMNPGNLAVHNDETLHYIARPELIAKYEAKYDAVLRGQRLVNAFDEAAPVNVLFSPDGGAQAIDRIAALIDQEREAILFAVFSLRNIAPRTGGKAIFDRLVDAHRRGVTVVVVTDRKQSDGIDSEGNQLYTNDRGEDILRAAGIPVYEVLNRATPYNAMHTKYAVFGVSRPIVVTDAGNWSKASLGSGTSRPTNDESVLVIDSHALDGGVTGLRYLGNFLEIVHAYGTHGRDGKTPTEGPPAKDTLARLQALPGWPSVEVVFSATVETRFGQQVHATGDHAVLGQWARTGSVPLHTDAASYPRWTSAPVVVPFGTRLEYKLIKRDGAAIEWERGANRALLIDPTDRRTVGGYPQPAIATDLRWR